MKEFQCEMCGKVVKRGEMHSVEVTEWPNWKLGKTIGDGVDGCEQICKKCSEKIQGVIRRTKENAVNRRRL